MTALPCKVLAFLPTFTLLLVLAHSRGLAAECDSVLVSSVESARSDYSLQLASLQLIDEKEYEKRQKAGKGNLSVLGDLLGGSADYKEFLERAREYLNFHAFAERESAARFYLKTYLPDGALDAWTKCMTGRHKVAAYARNPTTTGLTLRVEWNPPPGVTGPQAAIIEVPEGGLIRGRNLLREKWEGAVSRSYPITRTPGTDLRVVVSVANQSDDFVVPARREIKEPSVTIRVSGWIDHGAGNVQRTVVDHQQVGYNFTQDAPGHIKDFALTITQYVDGKRCPEAANTIRPGALNFPSGTIMDSTPEFRDVFQNGCQVAGGTVIQCFVDPMRVYRCTTS